MVQVLPATKVIEVHPDLVGLKGGKKRMWTRLNRDHMMDYLGKNGRDAFKVRFNMSDDSVDAFLARREYDIKLNKMSEADKWIMDYVRGAQREQNRRIADLEERVDRIEPITDVVRSFLGATAEQITHRIDPKVMASALLSSRNNGDGLEKRS